MSAITNSIVGIVVGIVVALIITLILANTVFKDKRMTILYVILFVLFAGAGAFVQTQYFTAHASAMPTPQEQIDNIDATITDNWKNTNGGFTFEQIKKAQDDNECPFYDDQIINLKCHDFGSYVVFSYKNGNEYENILFYKSDDGLILDGVINTYASLTGMKWFFAYDLSTFNWVTEKNKEPYYWTYHTAFDWHKIDGNHDDLVSVSRQTQEFVKWTHAVRTNQDEMIGYVMNNASTLTAKNATSHFIKFRNVELIGSGSEGLVKINSFYNYLYEQMKGFPYNTSKLIDCANCLCLPIPDTLKQNYPISPSKKAEYGDADYYGVYRCNIAAQVTYVKGETVNATVKNDNYVDTIKKDDKTKDKVKVDTVQSTATYSKLNVSFRDTNNSDVSSLNLTTKPVKIQFTCRELNLSKIITIDSLDKLNAGVDVLLNKDMNWEFYIESEALIFENFRGTLAIRSDNNSTTFDYYYLNNYTVASVGLNAVGNVDLTDVDLSQNPVKIILANDNHSYQFVFDDNSKIDSYQSMLVEMGTYNYTILSKQLEFASVTGTLTITSTDKVMLFNYAVTTYNTQLSFSINVEEYSNVGYLRLYSDTSNVTLIRDTLSSAKVYTVTVVVYDQDGRLMHSYLHTHSSTGSCGDSWQMNDLNDGETYTLQLRFTDRDDPTKTYLSDVADFVYSSSKGYRVIYNTVKNY
ncbi:MAG: hypothetical protein MR904_03970 [Clostridia bacterium]|nr:hypothetical protein [Clostridia bacterium]